MLPEECWGWPEALTPSDVISSALSWVKLLWSFSKWQAGWTVVSQWMVLFLAVRTQKKKKKISHVGGCSFTAEAQQALAGVEGKRGCQCAMSRNYFFFCCSCYAASWMLLFFPCILRALWEDTQSVRGGSPSSPTKGLPCGAGALVQTADGSL